MISIKSESELKLMRVSGKVVGQALVELEKKVKPGVTTLELDKFAYEFFKKNDCVPAFLGYHGYPATICTSVKTEVVHGIPGKRVLRREILSGLMSGLFIRAIVVIRPELLQLEKSPLGIKKLLESYF